MRGDSRVRTDVTLLFPACATSVRRGTESRTRKSGLMRASSARAVPRRRGDRGDSNPLISRITTWCIDHFCFGQRPPPGNRTPFRLHVTQLLAIELEAVKCSASLHARAARVLRGGVEPPDLLVISEVP